MRFASLPLAGRQNLCFLIRTPLFRFQLVAPFANGKCITYNYGVRLEDWFQSLPKKISQSFIIRYSFRVLAR